MENQKNEPLTGKDVYDFESLYDSFWRCRSGVSWKPSTKQFTLNAVEKCLEMENQLSTGTWKEGKPRPITIRYPKKRDGLSIPFRDRVYQRSLNDLILYPEMSKHFILDNCACQKKKGTDFARTRMKKHLWNHFTHYGTSGYVVQVDIHGYYPSMRHDVIEQCFAQNLSPEVLEMAMRIIQHQYTGEVGCNPGSQLVQIAGISVLNDLDHKIKEQLRVKHYIRYMDDFFILVPTAEEADCILLFIKKELESLGFEVNPTKTHISPLKKGFRFLGFDYRMTESGKIIMTLNSENIKHERRKLRRMVGLVKKGRMKKEKVYECYIGWKNTASKGNTHKMLQRMDQYLKSLWEE